MRYTDSEPKGRKSETGALACPFGYISLFHAITKMVARLAAFSSLSFASLSADQLLSTESLPAQLSSVPNLRPVCMFLELTQAKSRQAWFQ